MKSEGPAPQPQNPTPTSTFVVRLWQARSQGAPQWRGRIEHLQSGQAAGFQDVTRMLSFMQALGAFPPMHDAEDRGE
jgi:hypothetical protein